MTTLRETYHGITPSSLSNIAASGSEFSTTLAPGTEGLSITSIIHPVPL